MFRGCFRLLKIPPPAGVTPSFVILRREVYDVNDHFRYLNVSFAFSLNLSSNSVLVSDGPCLADFLRSLHQVNF